MIVDKVERHIQRPIDDLAFDPGFGSAGASRAAGSASFSAARLLDSQNGRRRLT